MIKSTLFIICFFLYFSVSAQNSDTSNIEAGINYIKTKVYSFEENQQLLDMYTGLRVADVSDGMDMVGLPGTGLVDPDIHPDWIDLENLTHQFRGIAVTARYVPTQRPGRPAEGQEFQEWSDHFYATYSDETFTTIIKPGSAIMIDDVESKDIGSIGSYNILAWKKAGAVGVVTDASARDTDEIALEKVPLYLRKKGRGIRPGRNELESVNRPVVIGGVLVCPGDVVVADGDGVIIVPRAAAVEVAEYARNILNSDKSGRKDLYESMGMPLDKTVK